MAYRAGAEFGGYGAGSVDVFGEDRGVEAIDGGDGVGLVVGGMTVRTGPKISSRAMVAPLSTLPKTVGSTNQPLSRWERRPPPVASVAPSSLPLAM